MYRLLIYYLDEAVVRFEEVSVGLIVGLKQVI